MMSCQDCQYFKEYMNYDILNEKVSSFLHSYNLPYPDDKIDSFQSRMSDGFCLDPNPLDDNMPRFKVDYCDHLRDREIEELK